MLDSCVAAARTHVVSWCVMLCPEGKPGMKSVTKLVGHQASETWCCERSVNMWCGVCGCGRERVGPRGGGEHGGGVRGGGEVGKVGGGGAIRV